MSPTNTRDKIKYVSFINKVNKPGTISSYRKLEYGDGTATPSFMKKTDGPPERVNVSQDGGFNFIKVASESGIPTSDRQVARSNSNTRQSVSPSNGVGGLASSRERLGPTADGAQPTSPNRSKLQSLCKKMTTLGVDLQENKMRKQNKYNQQILSLE